MKIYFTQILLAVLLSVILLPVDVVAQFEEGRSLPVISSKLIGSSIAADSSRTSGYVGMGEDFSKIKNIISFYIREADSAATYFGSGFSAKVIFDLELTNDNVTTTQSSKSLEVNFDTSTGAQYLVRAYMVLSGEAEKVTITVRSLAITGASGWTPHTVLQLDNDIQVLQYYHTLGPTSFSGAGLNGLPSSNADLASPDELLVSWMWGHEHYNLSQLEWAFIDSAMIDNYTYDLNNADNLFQNNSSRVDLDFGQEHFKVPLLYPAGNLFFRVRPCLRRNNGNVITGAWSPAKIFGLKGHEDSLNWVTSTGFSEDGKSKTVIQYFDGTLRSRQTVTKDNSTGNTIVAETLYDLQGRQNIQVLPTPTIDNTIKYFKDFNRFVGQQLVGNGVFRHFDDPAKYFDLTPIACAPSPPLDSTSGNGRYYSGANDWLATESKSAFIPNAGGYAYTETRFMDDATERVRSQGGIGASHQIGSGHETTYWYGKPSQAELDALFGTEVGDAGHYSKNMVQDPNQQLSVSYVDMHGRTIATALAGDSTAGIQSILNAGEYPQAVSPITDSLLTVSTNLVKNRSIESVSTLLVPAPNSQYEFNYELDPAIVGLFNCTGQQVCFDCKYDLEISIKSENCEDTLPIIRRYNSLRLIQSGNPCDSSIGFSGEGFTNVKRITFSHTLDIGAYVVRKTLTINDSLFQQRRDSALNAFLCTTEHEIYLTVLNSLMVSSSCDDPKGTKASCDTCFIQLGDFNAYRLKYLLSIGLSPAYTGMDNEIWSNYKTDSTECVNACGGKDTQLETLASLRSQLLHDMMPFTGQYSVPVDSIRRASGSAVDYSLREAKYNIFTDRYILNGNTVFKNLYYRKPLNEDGLPNYFTEQGQVDSIHALSIGGQPMLANLSPVEFAAMFQPSWANSLVTYHPEYTKLKFAEGALSTSFAWLDKVQGCDSWQQAFDSGYLNPLNNASALPYPSGGQDPFFREPANNLAKVAIDKMINQGVILDNNGIAEGPSIWQLANAAVLCADKDSVQKESCIYAQRKNGLDPAITSTGDKNKAWQHFKTMYLSYRYDKVVSYINAQAGVLTRQESDSLLAQGKRLIFPTMNDLAQQNRWSAWQAALNSDTAALATLVSVQNPVNNCVAQRPIWKAQLQQCEALIALLATGTKTDSVKVEMILTSILDSMEMVCTSSITPSQPYGASSTNPSFTGYPKNFEQVINGVLINHGIDTAAVSNYFCNPYSIRFPKPVGLTSPLFVNHTNLLDSCACQRFGILKMEAGQQGFDTLTLDGLQGLNQYFRNTFNDTISGITWNGLQECSRGLVKDTCFISQGIDQEAVPPCTTCAADTSACGKPVLYSVSYLNSTGTDNVKLNFRTSSGTFNCKIIVTDLATNVITYFTIDSCGASTDTVSLPPCTPYAFQVSVGSATHGLCYDTSDTHILPACVTTCKRTYHPIALREVVVLPPFLSCDYKKPCASCSDLDAYTTEFKILFPGMPGVPHAYTDSMTLQMAEENNLWARFLNYRSGLSRNALEFASAFSICQADSGCVANPAVNDLILAARTAPFPSEYIAQSTISIQPGFASSTGDNYVIYISQSVDTCGSAGGAMAICNSFEPVNGNTGIYTLDSLPCRNMVTQALFISKILYERKKDSLVANFDSAYTAACLSARYRQKFYVRYFPKEYHYTLYYYDQAGNLVKTLPPAGVKPNYKPGFLDSVKNFRKNGGDLDNYSNNNLLATHYRYNSINQVVVQRTPDAGISRYWYDQIGRLAVSQNSKQIVSDLYSYTIYDSLGRITEVGEKPQSTAMNQNLSQDAVALQNWINGAGVKTQITRTVYDEAYTPLASAVNGISGLYQGNLRNRVSYTSIKHREDQPAGWDAASFYSYDIHGNVDTLLQDYQGGMGNVLCATGTFKGNRFKRIVYGYDLVSGKVNDVAYQAGHADQFFHRYQYDAENRLIKVNTSRDKIYWEREATYDYYRHGPLARTVLGENQVQGVDFAHTIQGWLKGVNSTAILHSGQSNGFDMGNDGNPTSLVAGDAYGFSLNYFAGDYKAVQTAARPFTTVPVNLPADAGGVITGGGLFNGNIAAMALNIPKLGDPLVYGYRYDQLNRLVRMDAFNGLRNTDNSFAPVRTLNYHEAITYDPNGNIRTYVRNGTTAGGSPLAMDKLTYQYEKLADGRHQSNRLRYVHDQVADGNYPTDDINSQKQAGFTVSDVSNDISTLLPGDNYGYDPIGNLVKDTREGITNIEWTVYGKISRITKGNDIINYTYDAMGNRISKAVRSGGSERSTYYVRDASGNVISIYSHDVETAGNATISPLSQTEIHLYGSSRLGIYNVQVDVQNCLNPTDPITIFSRGNKFFELTNHLGNVLVTVSDKKIQHTTNNITTDYYTADVVTANDYYPFGMQTPGRKFTQPNRSFRFGFNGKENDNEVKGEGNQQDYGMRIYDTRLGRFLSVDPITISYPELTPYQYAENSPVLFIDLDGLEKALPWYLKENKNGGKPVLTLGLGNLPRAKRIENYQMQSGIGKVGVFTINTLFSAWNNIANTWNDGIDGKTGSQMLQESVTSIEQLKLQDLKKVETWETMAGGIVTAYATKRIGGSVTKGTLLAERIDLRRNFAHSFYKKVGGNVRDVRGINLTEEVSQVSLNSKTKLFQWTIDGKLGDYFSTSANAKNLGLPQMADGTPAYFDRATNVLKPRTLVEINLSSSTELTGLKSIAGDIKPWDGTSGVNKGGDIQIYSPQVKATNPQVTPVQ